MIGALFLAAAASAPTPAATLGCHLTTPGGHEVAFTALLGSPTAVLEPVAGAAWPLRRVIGPGGFRQRKVFEADYYFADRPVGISLKIVGERATLVVGKRGRGIMPRAAGFCLPRASQAAASSDTLVSPSADAIVPAFDMSNWPDEDCGLVTRSGRRSTIRYSIDGLTRSQIRTSDPALIAGGQVTANRLQGLPSRFQAAGGTPSGTELLVVDRKLAAAVQLIEFDRIGAPAVSAEPATALCGHRTIVRRAV
jgi:hypothetical protein